jgi:AmmeMemoRadiSam system protein B
MAHPLPRLRRELDIMPSPLPEQPGLLIRDPFHYTDAVIIVPPVLAQGLMFFDGQQTELDLQAHLTRLTGDLSAGEASREFVKALRVSGFLDCEEFHEMRGRKQREFAAAAERTPAHAGSAYPAKAQSLSEKLTSYGSDPDPAATGDSLVALAAPHVSPEGGFASYAAAYRRLNPRYADHTFIVLGTSHYGEPEKFGLTRKSYVTPLGRLETDQNFVDTLAQKAPESVVMEDYCHRSEHSIEFQCIFLQHVLGRPNVRIVPILCGPLAQSLFTGQAPETDPNVERFFEALGEAAEIHRKRVIWILGIDLAHIGRRYGDPFTAAAGESHMQEVRERDEARLDRVCEGDAAGFFDLVHPNYDDLRWCGYSPVYTFLRSVRGARGKVLNYEQWNIDPQSVVSFTGMEFTERGDRREIGVRA